MYSINQWCGRFGNNIQQISNAIFYCKENELIFSSPDNELINTFSVNFGDKKSKPGLFYFHIPSRIGNGNSDFIVNVDNLRKVRRNICLEYILPNLKVSHDNILPLDDDVVVAHIRGGDIFKGGYCGVVSNYLQNPLKYYIDIIDNYRKVIIVTEDYNNPIVEELSKLEKVEVKITSVEESIEILLSTRNLITSGVSSFGIACSLLSKNIKKIHYSNLYLDEVLNHNEFYDDNVSKIFYQIDIDRYIKFGDWMNTVDQRKIMIDYQ
jgi:hypothetical protein